MEDLAQPETPTIDSNEVEPQGNNDPRDPLRPDVEEENGAGGTPPMAAPYTDMETQEDDAAPIGNGANGEESAARGEDEKLENGNPASTDEAGIENEDEESELEDLDEAEFEDFDPSALAIPDKPQQVDESNVNLLGVHKRKRTAEEEAERERKKKKKEKKREKPSRKKRGGDDDFSGGEEIDGKRVRKSKIGSDGQPIKSSRRERTPINEDDLTPEERRRRALERKMDDAVKTHRVSRRKAAQDIEERADQEVNEMRARMAKACEEDNRDRNNGKIATHKLKILPEVVALMNRNTIQSQLVDPDINILEAVRFMLEPADQDAALPNIQIQRELFKILTNLNIGKDALIASSIGKLVLFYTKSSQAQPDIKRQAEHLVQSWTSTILGKKDSARGRPIETKQYDPVAAAQSQRGGASQADRAAMLAEKRRKVLAQPGPTNRARVEGGVGTYTIAPVNNLSNAQGVSSRKLGANDETFRKIAARSAAKSGKR
ncbi:uncharacterized protein MYCFIDRAFT_150500 [Pseudocercospora fijiensis CIRAD86]|uniref:TFIIS N-terminal domain-containing protein n=1 Tax=Pseudocercospora fijiensis (strain CIRAD86) TaxID=383855 RepID=M2Z6L1_PSEFD|nr:uncharacterized protein MYCFIDRAFT_150500 [Pseudocercospora fijiensis CIRAD86]EME85410.1 hypothetical protein MYCFIDRAFT_150500 [Pseudocercospora fijiensis CIRAD86]